MPDDTTTSPALGTIETFPQTISKQADLKTTTVIYRGDWKELADIGKSLKVGTTGKQNSSSAGNLIQGFNAANEYIAGVVATRQQGGLGTLQVTFSARDEIETWNLDFLEIQKPIINWHFGLKNGPDIQKLRKWQRLETIDGAWEAYTNFLTEVGDESSKLTGDTLKLAEKIIKGVEYFSVYTPVLTRTSVVTDLEDLSLGGVGKIGVPKAGNSLMGNLNLSTLTALAKEWLKTADRLQGAVDGTFQRVEQWTGADKWDEDLYETADSGTGDAS